MQLIWETKNWFKIETFIRRIDVLYRYIYLLYIYTIDIIAQMIYGSQSSSIVYIEYTII